MNLGQHTLPDDSGAIICGLLELQGFLLLRREDPPGLQTAGALARHRARQVVKVELSVVNPWPERFDAPVTLRVEVWTRLGWTVFYEAMRRYDEEDPREDIKEVITCLDAALRSEAS